MVFGVFCSRGGMCTLSPPSLSSRCHFYPVCPLCLWWLVVVGRCLRGIGVLAGVDWYCDTWLANLNWFSPATSSHCGRCTLIRCSGTRVPRMQRQVVRTKVIAILLLTYPHIFEQGRFYLVARQLANLFKVAVASTPSIPSTEAKKGEKCRSCWSHASRYIPLFPLSASCRHLFGYFVLCYLESVFITHMY